MSTWDPERNQKGRYPARPRCPTCKHLVVRVRCNECSKLLCSECSRLRADAPDNHHFCIDCVDQLLFPFVGEVTVSEDRSSSTA